MAASAGARRPGRDLRHGPHRLSPLKGILAFENVFFFSGHTALPYLYALIFWSIPWARRTFLAGNGVGVVET